jgi:hypothetical protein
MTPTETTLRRALEGDDPEMPQEIQPIGWLLTMIQECKRHAKESKDIEDISAYYEMISEVEHLYNRAREALAATQEGEGR